MRIHSVDISAFLQLVLVFSRADTAYLVQEGSLAHTFSSHRFIMTIITMMQSSSALSDLQPWPTKETQTPINLMQAQFVNLARMAAAKSVTRPAISLQQGKPNRKGRTLTSSSLWLRQPSSRQPSTESCFNHRQSHATQPSNYGLSQSKMQRLLEQSKVQRRGQSQTTPANISTQMSRQEHNQATQASKCPRYHPNRGLLQFTNTVISCIRDKPQPRKVSFSEFLDIKKKQATSSRYPERVKTDNWPDIEQGIHVKSTQQPPQQWQPLAASQVKASTIKLQPAELGNTRKDRRRLISSKRCRQVKTNMLPSELPQYSNEQFQSHSLQLPSN